MLSIDQMSRVTKEIILRMPPSLTTAEAVAHRKAVEADIVEMRKQGLAPDLPCDFEFEATPPRGESKLRQIRANPNPKPRR